MLQQLRDKTKSFVSVALLILLVISFGIWGINDIFRNQSASDWVAKVGPMKISPQLLQREVQNQTAQLRAMLGAGFTPAMAKQAGLMQRALDTIIGFATMELETAHLGLRVGNAPIIAMLQQTPELRGQDGQFDRRLFQQTLQNQGMTEASFIDQQKRLLARNILVRSISLPITVPELALDDLAKATAQRRVAEVVSVNADKVSIPDPTDEQLKTYFDAHADNYKSTETRSFTVLNLLPADIGKTITVPPEEVKAYFDKNQADFEHPEKRDIMQVVLDNPEKAKQLVDAAHQNGLPKAAKEHGIETTTLTQLARKDLPEALGDAVFGKGVGAIGGPVQTNLGYHIFVVEKITPGRKENFEQVNASIRAKLQTDKATESLTQTANKIDDMLAGGKSLEDIASSFGLKLQKIENQPNDSKPSDTLDAETLKAVTQQGEGETSPLMERKEGGYTLVRVDHINSSHNEDFAAMKEQVTADWEKSERMKKAAEIVTKAGDSLKKGDSLASLSQPGLVKNTSTAVRMDEWKEKDAAVPREVLQPLFNMGKGEVAIVSTAAGDVAVRVKTIQPGSDKDVEARKAAMKDQLGKQWLAQHIEELGADLQKQYPVKLDEHALQRMSAEN